MHAYIQHFVTLRASDSRTIVKSCKGLGDRNGFKGEKLTVEEDVSLQNMKLLIT